jgi:uncharacterized protein YecT (DUF1311 family)
MIRLLLAAAALVLPALMLPGGAANAAPRCAQTPYRFDRFYCLLPEFAAADRDLNRIFARLHAGLDDDRRRALRDDEAAWLRGRDRDCTLDSQGSLYVDLACATRLTAAHARFLAARYRACVRSRCSDLDFYDTQDGDRPDRGPKLLRYPTVSRYHGPDAGYIAVYTHDDRNALYSVGGDIYVVGFIRLRGRYDGRIFEPEGYDGKDISADPDFKKLTDALFPGHEGGTWAGGDTGGFVRN